MMCIQPIPSAIAALLFVSFGFSSAVAGVHHTFRYAASRGYTDIIESICFSPDSSRLAVAASRLDDIDLESGQARSYKIRASQVRYTSSSKHLFAIRKNDPPMLLDVESGQQRTIPIGKPKGYLGFTLELQGGKLLFKSIHDGGPTAKYGKIQVGDELIGVGNGLNERIDGVVGNSVRRTYELLKGEPYVSARLRVQPRGTYGEAFARTHTIRRAARGSNPNEQLPSQIAWNAADSHVRLFDPVNGKVFRRLEPKDVGAGSDATCSVSNDGKRFAVLSKQISDPSLKAIEVFDISTSARIAYLPLLEKRISDVDLTPDGRYVLVAAWDSVEIGDIESSRYVGQLSLDWTQPLYVLDTNSGPNISNIRIGMQRQLESGGRVDRFSSPRKLVHQVAVSSRRIVATADNTTGRVKLWDMLTGALLHQMPEAAPKKTQALAFSPDGKWLAYHIDDLLHVVDVSNIEPIPLRECVVAVDERLEKYPNDYVAKQHKWMLLRELGQPDAAAKLEDSIKELIWKEQERQSRYLRGAGEKNEFAYKIAVGPKPKNLELALRLATASFDQVESGLTADTIGRIYYEMGDLENAVKHQKVARKLKSSDELIKEALLKYQTELADSAETR